MVEVETVGAEAGPKGGNGKDVGGHGDGRNEVMRFWGAASGF